MSRSDSRASSHTAPLPRSHSVRARPISQSSRPPLESLIYTVVPSLAPPRTRHGSIAGSGGVTGSSGRSSALGSRAGDDDVEGERREKVRELMHFCDEIMESRMTSSSPLGLSQLPDAARRLLAQSQSGSRGNSSSSGPEKALRFGGVWNKLSKGKTLASPLPHLQFLLALSQLDPDNSPSSDKPASSRKSKTFPVSQPVASTSRLPPPINNAENTWSGKGKSKADVLNDWRAAQSRPVFPSDLLLRDTLYLLQGIDGRYIHFARRPPKEQNPYATQTARSADGLGFPLAKLKAEKEPEGDEVVGIEIVADEAKDGYISGPTRTILVQLSEMGVMYRKIMDFSNSRQVGTSKGGMTEQSLCHFLHHELSEYHRLLAVLESQLSESLAEPTGPASGLTLLRLGLWTEEIKIKLRMMSEIVDDALSAHGGALVSRIHARTRHGDPFVRRFMDQILEEVSKPFFLSLQKWIFSGDLQDPFQEFFVQLNPDPLVREGIDPYTADLGFEGGLESGLGGDEAGRVWEKKYVFVKAMVPGFVNEDFAKKIFSTGRSLNFIRYTCFDNEWIETQAKLANAGRGEYWDRGEGDRANDVALKYSDLAGLERSIDDAYSIASDRLLEIFFDKFRLLDHLRALKSYLMLGAGDFTEVLLEAIAPRLAKPAISLYRHHLTSDLETAIRGSNAQYDNPDILRRLDARILEYSHGELGWDCFALEYKTEAPLNAVLDSKAMIEYDRLFHHLWRVKRVEVALSGGWMKIVSGSRLFEKIPGNNWHSARIIQAEMVHFLRQLQAFYQLEVIECSWQALMDFTDKRQGDLDSLILAHRAYLDRVVKKVLLLGHKREKEMLLNLVQDAFEHILQFRAATDDLYAWSLTEATRQDHLRDASRGLYSTPLSSKSSEPNMDALEGIRNRVKSAAHAFSDRLTNICHLAASHPDLDIRFLAVRINFNGVFKRVGGKSRSVRSGQ